MQNVKKLENNNDISNFLSNLKNCMTESFDDTIVSVKDIEECVDVLAEIIGNAINIAIGVSELN